MLIYVAQADDPPYANLVTELFLSIGAELLLSYQVISVRTVGGKGLKWPQI